MSMNKALGLTLGAAALSLSVLIAGTTADKQTHKIQKVDLSELKDGETRNLGKGDSAISATRKGDVVTITYGERDGEKKTIQCTLGKDSCYAMTVDGAGKTQVVVLNKSGKEGKEPDRIVIQDGDDAGKGMFVFSDGEGGADHQVIVDAVHPGMSWTSSADAESLPGVKVIRIHDEAALMLECPEGDATLTLKKGEENSGPYFCPKHNVKMEKATAPVIMKRVVVDTKSTDDKDDEE
jgi:hypothetical protein